MNEWSRRVVALVALSLGTEAVAEGWHGYASLGAGVTLDALSEWRAKGPALQGYLGVEAPPGLSLGVILEGAETWGKEFSSEEDPAQRGRVQLDYKALGLEARLRFFRDKPITPWLGARLARSWAKPLTPDDLGRLRREKFEVTSMAFRLGVDGWVGEHWGLSLAAAMQWCDVKFTKNVFSECTKPLQTVVVGPVARF
ncbi:hypothetical protein JGU66_27785 [Myxococcaceae bacterium JPH2]|nr:hypothetical protein [Myxococcaceae bacterium JPH2]